LSHLQKKKKRKKGLPYQQTNKQKNKKSERTRRAERALFSLLSFSSLPLGRNGSLSLWLSYIRHSSLPPLSGVFYFFIHFFSLSFAMAGR